MLFWTSLLPVLSKGRANWVACLRDLQYLCRVAEEEAARRGAGQEDGGGVGDVLSDVLCELGSTPVARAAAIAADLASSCDNGGGGGGGGGGSGSGGGGLGGTPPLLGKLVGSSGRSASVKAETGAGAGAGTGAGAGAEAEAERRPDLVAIAAAIQRGDRLSLLAFGETVSFGIAAGARDLEQIAASSAADEGGIPVECLRFAGVEDTGAFAAGLQMRLRAARARLTPGEEEQLLVYKRAIVNATVAHYM